MTMELRINHIVLRYDNVPSGTRSAQLSRFELPSREIILSRDFFWRRGISPDEFERVLDRILGGEVGVEMRRLNGTEGLKPVLYVDFVHRGAWRFFISLNPATVRRLARARRDFSAVIRGGRSDSQIRIPSGVLSSLARMGGTLELS